MKFKVGDEIRFVSELDDLHKTKNGISFTEEMQVLTDRKPRRILSIIYFTKNNFDADIEGVKKYRNSGWNYHEDDFEKVEPKLEVTTSYRDPKWCMVSDDKKDWMKRILIHDASGLNLKFPYRTICPRDEKKFLRGETHCSTSIYEHAKPCPEYKAYSEPKLEWIGKIVEDKKSGKKLNIENITRNLATDELVLSLVQQSTGDIFYTTMQDFFDKCVWLDGSPCGIKQ